MEITTQNQGIVSHGVTNGSTESPIKPKKGAVRESRNFLLPLVVTHKYKFIQKTGWVCPLFYLI